MDVADKIAFVSELNGTSLWEITCITNYGFVLGGVRALLLALAPTVILQTSWARFLLEWTLLILPMVAITTVLSNEINVIFFTTLLLTLIFILMLPERNRKPAAKNDVYITNLRQPTTEELLNENLELSDDDSSVLNQKNNDSNSIFTRPVLPQNQVPFVTMFRSWTTVISCICILSVDFHVFPRRLAKTEVFGTGLMDTGVGLFIVSNAIVSPEARGRNSARFIDKLVHIRTAILSSWPLWTIGFLRVFFVKLSGYQEHVSEYGVHWNFFFTLAAVKILSSLVLSFISVSYCVPLSIICIIIYQFLLSSPLIDLTSLILNNDRSGFVMANKEGLCSCIGYLALYLFAVQLGAYLFKSNRNNIKSWAIVCGKAIIFDVFLWAATLLSSEFVQPISRRFVNLAYVLWISALCIEFLVLFLLLDFFIIICISWRRLPLDSMPEKWLLTEKKSVKISKIKYVPPSPSLCLMTAVNRNQFVYFMLSNLTTGLVNFIFDTMSVSDMHAFTILSTYTFFNLLFIWILHMKQISLKFW